MINLAKFCLHARLRIGFDNNEPNRIDSPQRSKLHGGWEKENVAKISRF